ncbi:unnamed protein product, partial [marine sediment metagenome]
VAIATFPTKPAGLECTAELWLASDMAKVATSGEIPFTATGEDQSISLPIGLPAIEGSYPVFLEVFSNGQRIAVFRGDEDVVIAEPPVAFLRILSASVNKNTAKIGEAVNVTFDYEISGAPVGWGEVNICIGIYYYSDYTKQWHFSPDEGNNQIFELADLAVGTHRTVCAYTRGDIGTRDICLFIKYHNGKVITTTGWFFAGTVVYER